MKPIQKTKHSWWFNLQEEDGGMSQADCGCVLQYDPTPGSNHPPEFIRCDACTQAIAAAPVLLKALNRVSRHAYGECEHELADECNEAIKEMIQEGINKSRGAK